VSFSQSQAAVLDGTITLHLRVTGPRDRAVELVRNLEHSKRFLLPRIAGENSESTGGPGEQIQPVSASNRVNLDVLADYNPAVLGERRAPKVSAVAKEGEGEAPAAARKRLPASGQPRQPYTRVSQAGTKRGKHTAGSAAKPVPGAVR